MDTPCIEFEGYRDRQGYGYRRWRGRVMGAHRAAWIEENGPIPKGMCVCHACDNPPCINVEHLWLGTVADNNADMSAKGRVRNGLPERTVCPAGHAYDDVNTYIHVDRRGRRHRYCRECHRSRPPATTPIDL